jgi:AraC family transcriptional regulator
MLTNSLRTNAMSSFETRPSLRPLAIFPNWIERRAERRQVERADRIQAHLPHCVAANMVLPVVEISPPDGVKRRTARSPGMGAEIVQTTRSDRIESRFCAPVHLLAIYERGMRREGETFVEGLPSSTLRDFKRKLLFVPAGHKYRDWQEPRIRTRVAYFYIDPAGLAINPELDFDNISFAPRLFFEDSRLWDTALKLTTLIEGAGSDHRLYVEALGVVLAHELVRLNARKPCVEAKVRGGLAPWQQRTVVTYIEDHLGESISLATLAQLVRLSPYHFCRTFKQTFGMPAHSYHIKRRIERAKALLAESAPSVTNIGLTLGFGQTSSFSNTFREATGMTPTAYHRSLV